MLGVSQLSPESRPFDLPNTHPYRGRGLFQFTTSLAHLLDRIPGTTTHAKTSLVPIFLTLHLISPFQSQSPSRSVYDWEKEKGSGGETPRPRLPLSPPTLRSPETAPIRERGICSPRRRVFWSRRCPPFPTQTLTRSDVRMSTFKKTQYKRDKRKDKESDTKMRS